MFPGSQRGVWTKHRGTGQYYLHRFYPHQPDLNVTNPAVRDEIARVIGFWMELGLCGFRVDAVPFLLDLFRLPSDTFQLFLATGVLNARFGTLAAAVHTMTLAILGSLALAGRLRWQVRPLVRYAVTTLIATVVILGGLRVLFATALHREFEGADIVYSMEPRFGGAAAAIEPADAVVPSASGGDLLSAIRQRGVLRVGVIRDRLPYAFETSDGRLIGYGPGGFDF